MTMRHKSLILSMLANVVFSGLATASVVLTQESVSKNFVDNPYSEVTSHSTEGAIANQIAELEVKRALLDPVFLSEAPTIQQIDSQLKSLHERLVQIQQNNDQTLVNLAISEALTAQIVELEVQSALLESVFIPQNPKVATVESQNKSLRKRLIQIQGNKNQTEINHDVAEAIQTKIVELKAERALLEIQHSAQNPVIKAMNSKIQSLEKRLIELKIG
jgi:capsule polysaccharide export protein KpsE/RkpR